MDNFNDTKWEIIDKNERHNDVVRISTNRSGVFKFQAGVDLVKLEPLIHRIHDAHDRFVSVPILPDIATALEKEVVASSVFGTNTIEGANVSEEDTIKLLEHFENVSSEQIADEKKRRIFNIKNAYDLAESFAYNLKEKGHRHLFITSHMLKGLHEQITDGLTHPDNVPGEYRNNPKHRLTRVGDVEHGGAYVPPKCLDDIKLLIDQFEVWANDERISSLDPLIRAPLAHYYFERIHPFWDGNGRVGRVVEAMILKFAGYKYAPFALSRYYLDHIDEYFLSFNIARKQEIKKEKNPNTNFVEFFLNGMLVVLNRQHDRVNKLISIILFRNWLRALYDDKKINNRQYTIVTNLMANSGLNDLKTLRQEPWYRSFYDSLTNKTRERDIKKLQERGVIKINKNKKIKLQYP